MSPWLFCELLFYGFHGEFSYYKMYNQIWNFKTHYLQKHGKFRNNSISSWRWRTPKYLKESSVFDTPQWHHCQSAVDKLGQGEHFCRSFIIKRNKNIFYLFRNADATLVHFFTVLLKSAHSLITLNYNTEPIIMKHRLTRKYLVYQFKPSLMCVLYNNRTLQAFVWKVVEYPDSPGMLLWKI